MGEPAINTQPAYQVIGHSENRAAWLGQRAQGIGASEIAAVLGESPYESALSLYARKTMPETEVANDAEHLFWGLQLERAIAEGYSRRSGRPFAMAGQLLQSVEYPWLLATLDSWTGPKDAAVLWPLEIKNVSTFAADSWADGAPRHVYIQCQQQMIVTGTKRCTVAGLAGGNALMWEDIEADPIEQRRIIHASRIFWHECVLAGVAPEPDGSEASRRALQRLYPAEAAEAQVELDVDTFAELDAELEVIKERQAADKKRRDLLENMIKATIADATYGVLPGGVSYSWKSQTRREYVVKENTSRVLRRHVGKNG